MNGNRAESRVRFSLRAKNTLVFVALLSLLILLIWLINRFGLQRFYLSQQLKRVSEARILLSELAERPDDEALAVRLSSKCDASGIAAILLKLDSQSENGVILFAAGGDEKDMRRSLNRDIGIPGPGPIEIYEQTESHTTYRFVDPVTDSERISCVGFEETSGGTRFCYVLSLSVARIAQTAAITNRFLLLIGGCVLLIGSFLVYFVTKRFTEPIERLTQLSEKMADLDFSERFQAAPRRTDETQLLGDNINHLADTLEQTIADLRQANLKLEQDVKEKEQENFSRQALLANISHELKTPIALVQGYAEGLRDGMCEDEETRVRYSDIIIDEAERMNRLVRQLLNLDELESGMMQIEKTRFDLAALLRDMTDSYAVRSESTGAVIKVDVPDTLPVESDELLVEQIVQNYLSNAFQYVTPGGLIRVSAQRADEENGTGAIIHVYNDGDAIPPEAMGQIWDKFYKVDKARTRSYGGSGIGLSVVRAATERLGGSCAVRNIGNGVEFTAVI